MADVVVGVRRRGEGDYQGHCRCGGRSGRLPNFGTAVEWLRRHLANSGWPEHRDAVRAFIEAAGDEADRIDRGGGPDEFTCTLAPRPPRPAPPAESAPDAP